MLKGNININEESVCDEKDKGVLGEEMLANNFTLKESWRHFMTLKIQRRAYRKMLFIINYMMKSLAG